MRRIVGITGGIGSGKSVVSRILRLKGYEVYDCDSQAKSMMDSSERILSGIRSFFGDEAFNTDGSLCRPYLSARVFADSEKLSFLNSLVHGEVLEDFGTRAAGEGGVLFVESAIMRTSGLDGLCSEMWLVSAPDAVRIGRVFERDSVSPDEVESRMKRQIGEYDFSGSLTVRVIQNDGVSPLLPQIDRLLQEIGKNNSNN